MTFTTTVTLQQLATRLNKKPEDLEVIRVYGEALELLGDATASAWRPIPQGVRDDLVIRVARSLWDAVKTQGEAGGQMTQVEGGTVVRRPRDPIMEVQAVLSRYVVMGIG